MPLPACLLLNSAMAVTVKTFHEPHKRIPTLNNLGIFNHYGCTILVIVKQLNVRIRLMRLKKIFLIP